jgi:Ca2+-binding EF-hand superfamily protein
MFNWFETWSIAVSFVTFYCGQFLFGEHRVNDTGKALISWTVILVNAGFVMTIGVHIVYFVWKRVVSKKMSALRRKTEHAFQATSASLFKKSHFRIQVLSEKAQVPDLDSQSRADDLTVQQKIDALEKKLKASQRATKKAQDKAFNAVAGQSQQPRSKTLAETNFDLYDQDDSGDIDSTELRRLLYDYGVWLSDHELMLVKRALFRGRDAITFDQFEGWWADYQIRKGLDIDDSDEGFKVRRQFTSLFNGFDANDNGSLDKEEFRALCVDLHEKGLVPRNFYEENAAHLGLIVYLGEFMKLLKKSNLLASAGGNPQQAGEDTGTPSIQEEEQAGLAEEPSRFTAGLPLMGDSNDSAESPHSEQHADTGTPSIQEDEQAVFTAGIPLGLGAAEASELVPERSLSSHSERHADTGTPSIQEDEQAVFTAGIPLGLGAAEASELVPERSLGSVGGSEVMIEPLQPGKPRKRRAFGDDECIGLACSVPQIAPTRTGLARTRTFTAGIVSPLASAHRVRSFTAGAPVAPGPQGQKANRGAAKSYELEESKPLLPGENNVTLL